MYDDADGLVQLEQKLRDERPNLLLIGAMTLSLPGAIQIAKMAKEVLGDEVTIVLGGKHASETIYRERNNVRHNPGSPLRLMSEGKIPSIIDLVVSGDGEYVIAKLGELVAKHVNARSVVAQLNELESCPGHWILGTTKKGQIRTILSTGLAINYSTLPIPADIFGFQGSFPVFQADRTAHVYSDASRGCVYDCFFCTERRSVNGPVKLQNAPEQLARQITAVAKNGKTAGDLVSAFVEDSILLMGHPRELNQLHSLLVGGPIIPFGGQITIPLFLRRDTRKSLIALKDVGLEYLFSGMETASETVAQAMSKNVGKDAGGWMCRNEEVVNLASEAGLRYGVAILFGLGENQATRIHQLEEVTRWQKAYAGNPCVVSMNWATQHPLLDVGMFDYIDWGTPTESELLPYFQTLFGEASEKYLVTQPKPTVTELKELEQLFSQLKLQQ